MEKQEKNQYKEYSKSEIMKSMKFTQIQKDLINSLLREEKKYTIEEVTSMIEKFIRQEAK
ncbi:hypothetical protein [Alkaliphilus peptidifermentans]|uniref:Uncharacterized protein n=1 Tax=Alkaliphilus peptidifermentans DSM 18978 TaxID=1120976 RepID=A0A1G5JXV4_9FIRM|nr:hypothetical protein [Alkaliphilus peptidifermentans]SCY93282.1 hypothetical protein SAMN03080606_03118 [Alkaliphilus peptidifermentans DSM 18978]